MEIVGWLWDEGNIAHLARHEVTPKVVLEVADRQPAFRENLDDRTAELQMIGPDEKFEWWTICILQSVDEPGLWKAITGWRSNDQEREWYWEVTG